MPSTPEEDGRYVVWFDIDNTLYSANTKIAQAMGKRIHDYFLTLGLDDDEASKLHLRYYTTYGLALRGLTKHHDIDPLDFDRKCDGTLPLEDMISFDENLLKLFQDIDRTKARVWALTNAFHPHARRVLKILKLEDEVEDLVYCDYEKPNFSCKPEPEYYHEALKKAGLKDPSKCLFVDDNRKNVEAAQKLGWTAVHFCEVGLESMEGGQISRIGLERSVGTPVSGVQTITKLEQLRVLWPFIFKN